METHSDYMLAELRGEQAFGDQRARSSNKKEAKEGKKDESIKITMHIVSPIPRIRGSGRSLIVESVTGLINGDKEHLVLIGEKLASAVRFTQKELSAARPNVSAFFIHEPTGQSLGFSARDLIKPEAPENWIDQIEGVLLGEGLRQKATRGSRWAARFAASHGHPAAFGPNSPNFRTGITEIYEQHIQTLNV